MDHQESAAAQDHTFDGCPVNRLPHYVHPGTAMNFSDDVHNWNFIRGGK
jgi:hypothetical protein